MLVWNVYYHDFNGDKIKVYNIFNHASFKNDVVKAIKECRAKDEFNERLLSDLKYYFWCKCEWEILISPWICDSDKMKVDVFNQVYNNWDIFSDYVWNNKDKLSL